MQFFEVDIRGQICPSTLLVALKEVNARKEALKSGELCLVLQTDNRDAVVTIPEAMENMGYEVTMVKRAGHYVVSVWGSRRLAVAGVHPDK